MAENANGAKGPSWFWITTVLVSAFGVGLVWWGTQVWSLASTATTAIVEIRGQLKELNDNYSASHDWMKQIATGELDDHDKIVGLQTDRDNMQRQLNALSGIRDPKGSVPP